jgi:hypothetical protein
MPATTSGRPRGISGPLLSWRSPQGQGAMGDVLRLSGGLLNVSSIGYRLFVTRGKGGSVMDRASSPTGNLALLAFIAVWVVIAAIHLA